MKYRKRPVVIEAVQLVPPIAMDALPVWLQDALARGLDDERGRGAVLAPDGAMYLRTMEGTMHARPSDWIICGVEGELYPCKDTVFRSTYEPAGGDA